MPRNVVNAYGIGLAVERMHPDLYSEVKPQVGFLRGKLSEVQLELAQDIASAIVRDGNFSSLEKGEANSEKRRPKSRYTGGWTYSTTETKSRLKFTHPAFEDTRISVGRQAPEVYVTGERVEWQALGGYWPRFIVTYWEVEEDSHYQFKIEQDTVPNPVRFAASAERDSRIHEHVSDVRDGQPSNAPRRNPS